MHRIPIITAHHDIDHMDANKIYLRIDDSIDKILPGNVNFMHNDRVQYGYDNTCMPNKIPEKMKRRKAIFKVWCNDGLHGSGQRPEIQDSNPFPVLIQ